MAATDEADVVDARRTPRIPVRLPVTVRHGGAAWGTETEDVGPRGCQLVSGRALPPGAEVVLSVSCAPLGRAVAATGRVTWSRPDPPARLGVSFQVPVTQRGWFDALLAADPRAERAAARVPLRLRGGTRLYLGQPPATLLDFSDDERAVLAAIGDGITAGELSDALAPRFHRARGALFSLLARRLVRLHPGGPDAAARWRAVLFPPSELSPIRGAPRPAAAQRLYDEAIQHLGAGRVELAAARFREVLQLFPGDASVAGTLARLDRWR